ncbi:hypothetical protein O6H91_03G015100 [Diphasiastrum complanatum]|uniref:Uncharacterized protein n=1 Tax=Diphasiastrum complanatum TaxID=34168 RepID=A0ACC2E416_DIPCM|nr:hypothetical protein O6H91_03G015100 [Diphasiastrum complanatum]
MASASPSLLPLDSQQKQQQGGGQTAMAADENWGTMKMRALAERLRHYRAPSGGCVDEDDQESLKGAGVVSSMGVPESKVVTAEALKPSLGSKKAAVLICLFQDADGELRVLLTKRAGSLSSHSGEVALPGGKMDDGDADDAATALREAKEEIGLDPSAAKVVTLLEPFLSKHLLRVTPVVALIPDKHKFTPCLNLAEVDALFDAPLAMFLKDEHHRSEQREWLGHPYRVHFFDFNFKGQQYLIWGLTAAILIRAACIIYQQIPSFGEFTPGFDHFPKQPHEKEPKL